MKACSILALIGVCAFAAPALPAKAPTLAPDYLRRYLKPLDHTRLRLWRDAWLSGLAQARAAGEGDQIAREGALLDPDAAVEGPDPPIGDYRCRVIKLGHPAPLTINQSLAAPPPPSTTPLFSASGEFTCRIGDGRFTKLDGQQRPVGRLWQYDATKLIFLGAMALGDESRALDYGRDEDRDMVGFLERIGPARWRLILPRPHWESQIDVIELVPKGTAG